MSRIKIVYLVTDDGRNITIVALIQIDSELDETLQLLATSDFLDCDHCL